MVVWVVVAGCNALSEDESELGACEVASDCALAHNECCGICGDLQPADVTAVNRRNLEVHRRRVCGGGDVGCPGIACVQRSPTVIATCEAGRCVTVELASHPATACSGDADCRVRSLACCECNAPTGPANLVGVSDEDAFKSLVCDPEQACDECGANYPPEATAVCAANGCTVEDSRMF